VNHGRLQPTSNRSRRLRPVPQSVEVSCSALWPIEHLRAIIAPVADCGIGGGHLHPVSVVGVQQIDGRPRIATLGNAKPAIVVSGMQD
jgi:hypothetical protein